MNNGHSSAPLGRFEARPDLHEKVLGPARSGRRFVIAAVVVIVVAWGALFLVFRDWRARHRALAEFGTREVASVVDPLADRVPPNVSPREWRDAVADTHAMLVTLTGSGLLDRSEMEQMRADLRARLARTTPETAVSELSRLWDDMLAKAGPILTKQSRPPYSPPRPKLLGGKGAP